MYDRNCWRRAPEPGARLCPAIIFKDGHMAETSGSVSSQKWTSTQAYIMAVVCLLVGGAVG